MPRPDPCSLLLRDLIWVSALWLLASLLAGPAAAASELATGTAHTCAIDGGQVKCRGLNDFFQLGAGGTIDRSMPVAVSGELVAQLIPANPIEPVAPLPINPIEPVVPLPVNPDQPVAPPPATQIEYTLSTGVIPEAAVTAAAGGTLDSVTLSVTLNLSLPFPAGLLSGQGHFAAGYNVYVAALVPSGRLGLTTTSWFMLPGTRSWTLLGFPIAAYLENVAQGATVSIDILQNIDMTGLLGTEFYVGYGLSDQEMLAARRHRGVYIAR